MPVYNHFYLLQDPQTGQSRFHALPLAQHGPVLNVEVRVPNALAAQLSQAGQTVPSPVSGLALIDTGASISAVDDSIIQSLGVSPVGIATVKTPSGAARQNQYPVRFVFPGTPLPEIETPFAIGSVLKPQGIIALIGRDVLTHFVLIYNGPGGHITLAF